MTKCTNCIHNEVCKFKKDYNTIKEAKEGIYANYEGWEMYEVQVTCNSYKPDTEQLWNEELMRQTEEEIAEVF